MLPTRSQFLIHFGKHEEFFTSSGVNQGSAHWAIGLVASIMGANGQSVRGVGGEGGVGVEEPGGRGASYGRSARPKPLNASCASSA